MTENPTKEQLAVLLRDKRHELKLTGAEVVQKLKAYGIEISDKTLWGYEKCIASPSVQTFLALCKIYGIDDITAEAKSKPGRMILNEQEMRLIKYFRAASPEMRSATLRMLEPETEDTALSVG